MLNKVRITLLSGTVLAVALTAFSSIPTKAAVGTRYAAGNFREGTSICACPVTVGNCVCEYTDPPAPAPAPVPVTDLAE
jgi:hypothetical protein